MRFLVTSPNLPLPFTTLIFVSLPESILHSVKLLRLHDGVRPIFMVPLSRLFSPADVLDLVFA